jgi:hypothetical protein
MERLYSWVALTALSVVILAALVDQLPASRRGGQENYAIATASISLIFGFLLTLGHVVDSLGNLIIGNVIESGTFECARLPFRPYAACSRLRAVQVQH